MPPLSFDGGTLTLTRQTPEGLQVVVWSLREGAVYRWGSAPLRTVAEVVSERQRGQQALAQRSQALLALQRCGELAVLLLSRQRLGQLPVQR